MENPSNCLVCSKTYFKNLREPLSPQAGANLSSECEVTTLKTLFQFLERYLGQGKTSVKNEALEQLLNHDLMGVCDDCLKTAKSFCNLFNEMKRIELLLNWKVLEIGKLFQNESQFVKNEPGTEGTDQPNLMDFIEWKNQLGKECHQAYFNSEPKLRLQNCKESGTKASTSSEELNNDKGAAPVQINIVYSMWKCSNCKKAFKLKADLKTHKRSRSCYGSPEKNPDEEIEPDFEPFLDEAELKGFSQPEVKVFEAPVVTLPISSRKSFKENKGIADTSVFPPPDRLSCPFCPLTFRSVKGLGQHKQTLHKGAQFQCKLCSKNFKTLANLQIHEKAKTCSESIEAMERSGNFPFSCDICNRGFRHLNSVSKHKLNFHEGIRFKCGHCKKISLYKTDISKHTKKVHGSLPKINEVIKKADKGKDTNVADYDAPEVEEPSRLSEEDLKIEKVDDENECN